MVNKMKKISSYLEYISKVVSYDTMILVTGDHGMRKDGNHGGSTKE